VGRVDAELVHRGLARSRRDAAELVAAGRVRLEGVRVTRPAALAGEGDALEVARADGDLGYASRAAHKLAGALDALESAGVPVRTHDAVCVDLGASTGGFTDVLLRRGARQVVAIDVGHDQLVARLREDSRVDVREGVNARDLGPASFAGPPDVVVGDLSFISLTLVLPAVARSVAGATDVLLMVKPQFEVGRERLGAGGVVRDPSLLAEAVLTVARAARELGLATSAVVPSPLPGPNGNREFFVRLRAPGVLGGEGTPPAGTVSAEPAATLVEAVRAAVATAPAPPADAWSSPPVPPVFVVDNAERTR
jgi:23S rRNA (cytidine1920-2'-O)/16S rRNA (cytidine1409-2'-O)-methyltransferase